MRSYWVYMLCSKRNGTLYIGVTNDLSRRIFEHRNGLVPGFTCKYGVTRLVWYESYENITEALQREKSMKRWMRAWKLEAIEKMNPGWRDLYEDLNA